MPVATAQVSTDAVSPVSRERRIALAGLVLGIVAFALQWIGLEPVVLHAITIVLWLVVTARRFGLILAAASVSVGWLATVFVAFTLAPAVSVDARLATSVLLAVLLGAAAALVTKVPPRDVTALAWRPLLASASGSLAWLAGLAWGLINPSGGGWSWAMYRDSTMDLWEMRTMIEYNGMGSLGGITNIQPLTHAVSASLVSPRVSVAASPETASAFLTGHGYHWTITVILTSFLAGLIVHRLGTRDGKARTVPLVGAALVSLAAVSHPVTGVAFELGQINVHCILVLVLASVGAALGPRRYTPLAISTVIVALGLLTATWILFAAVPGMVLVALVLRLRGLGLTREKVLEWVLPGAAIGGWAVGIYGWPLVMQVVTREATREHLVTQSTHAHGELWPAYSNPHSIWLSAVVGVLGIGCALLLAREERWRGTVALLATLGVAVGVVPSALAMGGFAEPLAYFPAKHLFIGTFAVVPLIVGAMVHVAGRSWVTLIVVLSITASSVVAALVVAQPTPTYRWTLTPVDVARGEFFGRHDAVAGQFIEFASSEELRVPWRYDSRHDVTVNLMMSSVGPDIDAILLRPMRFVMRTYRNDFAPTVACDLAHAESRPLVLVTRDPSLENEVQELCPAEDIRVELEPTAS